MSEIMLTDVNDLLAELEAQFDAPVVTEATASGNTNTCTCPCKPSPVIS